jgi:hypothetical protein
MCKTVLYDPVIEQLIIRLFQNIHIYIYISIFVLSVSYFSVAICHSYLIFLIYDLLFSSICYLEFISTSHLLYFFS